MAQINITDIHANDLKWENASSCEYLINKNIDIWRINVNSNLKSTDNLFRVLSADEIAKANRFFRERDKTRHIISHGAIRNILGKYLNQPPSLIEFKDGINKKPYIINKTGLHFNLSHSADWIILAISNWEIGADVELINYSFEYKDVMEGYFSDEEINFINEAQSTDRFFLLWTRKEVQIKATGKGLDDNIKLIPGLAGTHMINNDAMSSSNDWTINSFSLAEQYIASVAANPSIEKLRFWDVDFH
jgi:4'-phosphopantetheinyl transferase